MYNYIKHLIFKINPEIAHKIAIQIIKHNCILNHQVHEYFKPYLSQNYFGLTFDSPIGLAAGFDKNGETSGAIHLNGFGFSEVGTATLFPQEGNEKPRLFRLIQEEALINRLGFNNTGLHNLIENVKKDSSKRKIPLGINIGPNKNSKDFTNDYLLMIEKIYENQHLFNYITINISSPNTPGLRDMQKVELLIELLKKINEKVNSIISDDETHNTKKLPIFVKISPDSNDNDLTDIVHISISEKISGLIVSNTTIDKDHIENSLKSQQGGLSGKPLFTKSTKLLSEIYKMTNGELFLIGVGGISTSDDVIKKMRAGASLVQLYTSMIYQGPFIANKINEDLVKFLQREKIDNISSLIGRELIS
jgi:dihydroorotate dehydrogenase